LALGVFLLNLASCSSCAKDEPQPASGPDLKANPSKLKFVDRKSQPRISEEGGTLVDHLDAGARD